MKNMSRIVGQTLLYTIVFAVFIHVAGSEAFAAEHSSEWRPIYDTAMKWVNLGILVFLIVKFVKKPLMSFLGDQKEKLAQEIKQLEEEKNKFTSSLKETLSLVESGDAKIKEIKERIAVQGKKEKERVVEEAKRQSALMIEESKKKIQTKITHAKDMFKDELINAAISLALKRIPSEIMEEDKIKLTNNYLTKIETL